MLLAKYFSLNFLFPEMEVTREDSDDDNWQEKENSRTVSVKFSDDYDAEKEDGNKEVRCLLFSKEFH